MFTRVARLTTTAALLAALVCSPAIGRAQATVQVPPTPLFPAPPPVTEAMPLVHDPLVLVQLVRIEALLQELVDAFPKPPAPTPVPAPPPAPPKQ